MRVKYMAALAAATVFGIPMLIGCAPGDSEVQQPAQTEIAADAAEAGVDAVEDGTVHKGIDFSHYISIADYQQIEKYLGDSRAMFENEEHLFMTGEFEDGHLVVYYLNPDSPELNVPIMMHSTGLFIFDHEKASAEKVKTVIELMKKGTFQEVPESEFSEFNEK